MRSSSSRRLLLVIGILFLIASLLPLVSCSYGQSGPVSYDSGANNLTLTATQFTQYNFIRFDTATGDRTLTLPSATDIVSALQAPVGSFTAMVVAADGGNGVKIVGGTNVVVKTSASNVKANTSQTLFFILDNVSSGTQAVTVY